MKYGYAFVAFTSLALVFAAHAQTLSAREQFHTVQDYIVYYGEGRLNDLARFDLAILQPDPYDEDDLNRLKSGGTLVIAYLSVGEAEPYRDWFDQVGQEWVLGENQIWGTYFMDANQAGWRDLVLTKAGEYLAQGFDGIFLDTVDTAELYPDTAPGMVALIGQLREAYPDAILIQNRGFTVVEQTTDLIDGLMVEDLSTSYNFEDHEYTRIDNHALAEDLAELSERAQLVILSLDYATPDDSQTANRARAIARRYGFIPSVSVINLDDIPDYAD